MRKQFIQVTIAHGIKLTSPGMLGRKFDFKAGQSFLTQEWFYPSEPYVKGVLPVTPRDQWSFIINTRTDLPLFFNAEDIRQVVIPNEPETIRVFEGAPFKVIMGDC